MSRESDVVEHPDQMGTDGAGETPTVPRDSQYVLVRMPARDRISSGHASFPHLAPAWRDAHQDHPGILVHLIEGGVINRETLVGVEPKIVARKKIFLGAPWIKRGQDVAKSLKGPYQRIGGKGLV